MLIILKEVYKKKNYNIYYMQNYILNIDSSLSEESIKQQYHTTKFTYKLPREYKNVINLKLTSVELPNTSFVISEKKKNNYFNITIDNTTHLIKISDGNYIPSDLEVNIENQLKLIDIDFEFNLQRYNYLFKFYHKGQKKFSISFVNEDTNYDNLGSILGFIENLYQDNYIYQAEKIVNVTDNNYCFLAVNDFGNVYHNNKKYLSKIIVTNKKYEMTFDGSHKYVSKEVIFQQPIDLNVLNVSLEDYNSNLIDLNGIPFSFTLELTTIKNSLLKKYKELTFYNPQLMKLMLDDVMLNYFTNQTKDYKIGEKYDDLIQHNVTNHVGGEENDIDNQINLINKIDGDNLALIEIEEKDRLYQAQRKKRKMIKLIKKFRSKYPDKYNKIKNDKKKLCQTINAIIKRRKKNKKLTEKIVY